jgi:hypothetical protein
VNADPEAGRPASHIAEHDATGRPVTRHDPCGTIVYCAYPSAWLGTGGDGGQDTAARAFLSSVEHDALGRPLPGVETLEPGYRVSGTGRSGEDGTIAL